MLSSRLRARMMSAARRSTRPRSVPVRAAQAACAARALSSAARITAGVAECSRAITSPVAG